MLDPEPKEERIFLTYAALIIKEGSLIAGICWFQGITPKFIFDSCYALPTMIVVCSCHFIDMENNLRASAFEAVFMLAALLTSTLQTEMWFENLYMCSRLMIASITLIML